MSAVPVPGFADKPASAQAEHRAAWSRVAGIDREKAIVARADVYNTQRFRLDHQLTWHLTPLEKLVLAYGGPAPFGGSVNGVWVDVSID